MEIKLSPNNDIKLCPKGCFIILTEQSVFGKFRRWLKCSICRYMEKKK